MYFFILGGLEVRASDTRVLINASKQRAVLAALLLRVNNEVPVEELTEHVWDGRPPVAAKTTLQSYIYRLRQMLRPMAGVELATRSESYILQVDPILTDVWYFKHKVRYARERALEGDLSDSVTSLRNALAVWRGKALSGVGGAYFRQEAQYLEDERVVAQEELFSAEMALGKHRAIIPELQKLASVYQFHEMLRAQLMLALYRSGRQVEALQVYALIRRKLREDLGIEPGPELQGIYQAILEQVPATRIQLSSAH